MKTLHKRIQDGEKFGVRKGYAIRPCVRCGLMVVHVLSTGEPVHMHRNSRKCEERAFNRRKAFREAMDAASLKA